MFVSSVRGFLVYLQRLNWRKKVKSGCPRRCESRIWRIRRSGGQAINGFEEGIDEYIAQVGFDKAKKLWDMSLEAIDIIDERIAKYGIQCDWKKVMPHWR